LRAKLGVEGAPLGYAPALLVNIRLTRLAKDKHSSLFGPIVSFKEKKFITFAQGKNGKSLKRG
jgi:hypothetical protein